MTFTNVYQRKDGTLYSIDYLSRRLADDGALNAEAAGIPRVAMRVSSI